MRLSVLEYSLAPRDSLTITMTTAIWQKIRPFKWFLGKGELTNVIHFQDTYKESTKARNMCKIFSLVPTKKNLSPEKTETN